MPNMTLFPIPNGQEMSLISNTAKDRSCMGPLTAPVYDSGIEVSRLVYKVNLWYSYR
jgi:hypothetical protein